MVARYSPSAAPLDVPSNSSLHLRNGSGLGRPRKQRPMYIFGRMAAGLPSDEIERRVRELLERLELAKLAAANPFTLSGGEKRRLSVGTALATSPGALVLDEPTFGQDRRTFTELLALLAEFRDGGGAIAFASHDELFVDAFADERLRLERGRAA